MDDNVFSVKLNKGNRAAEKPDKWTENLKLALKEEEMTQLWKNSPLDHVDILLRVNYLLIPLTEYHFTRAFWIEFLDTHLWFTNMGKEGSRKWVTDDQEDLLNLKLFFWKDFPTIINNTLIITTTMKLWWRKFLAIDGSKSCVVANVSHVSNMAQIFWIVGALHLFIYLFT